MARRAAPSRDPRQCLAGPRARLAAAQRRGGGQAGDRGFSPGLACPPPDPVSPQSRSGLALTARPLPTLPHALGVLTLERAGDAHHSPRGWKAANKSSRPPWRRSDSSWPAGRRGKPSGRGEAMRRRFLAFPPRSEGSTVTFTPASPDGAGQASKREGRKTPAVLTLRPGALRLFNVSLSGPGSRRGMPTRTGGKEATYDEEGKAGWERKAKSSSRPRPKCPGLRRASYCGGGGCRQM